MTFDMPVSIQGRELPRFTLRQEDLASVGFWDVNSKHYLILKVELIGKRNTKTMGVEGSEDQQRIEGDFQVLNVRPVGSEPIDGKMLEKRDLEELTAKVRSGNM